MKEMARRTAAAALAGVVSASMLTGCGGEKAIDGTATVATVDGEAIPLGVLSLSVRESQAQTEAMYLMYLGSSDYAIWDTEAEEGGTYGEMAVEQALENVELMYILKAKAADYGVELSDDDNTAIAEAASEFMEANTEDTLTDLGVDEDMVKTWLELETYSQRMYYKIIADVDTEVSDDEAQQSSFHYVSVSTEDLTDDEIEEAKENLQTIIDNQTADPDADLSDTVEAVSEDYSALSGTFDAIVEDDTEETADTDSTEEDAETDTADADSTDADTETDAAEEDTESTEDADSSEDTEEESTEEDSEEDEEESSSSSSAYPDEVMAVLRTLSDGEVGPDVIETDSDLYMVQLDKVFDEDATESRKETIISERESDLYSDTTEAWKEAAEITTDEDVMATLVVTDSHKYTITTPSPTPSPTPEVTEEAEESTEETSEEATDEAADETTDETADDSAEDTTEDTAEESGDETEDSAEESDEEAETTATPTPEATEAAEEE